MRNQVHVWGDFFQASFIRDKAMLVSENKVFGGREFYVRDGKHYGVDISKDGFPYRVEFVGRADIPHIRFWR